MLRVETFLMTHVYINTIAARSVHKERYGISFNVVALMDSSGGVASDSFDALSDDVINSVVAWKEAGKKLSTHANVSKVRNTTRTTTQCQP